MGEHVHVCEQREVYREVTLIAYDRFDEVPIW